MIPSPCPFVISPVVTITIIWAWRSDPPGHSSRMPWPHCCLTPRTRFHITARTLQEVCPTLGALRACCTTLNLGPPAVVAAGCSTSLRVAFLGVIEVRVSVPLSFGLFFEDLLPSSDVFLVSSSSCCLLCCLLLSPFLQLLLMLFPQLCHSFPR